jgi:RimJ/RimL family protein N-acetyltransferase
MGHRYWPLWDLVVRTPRLELRMPADPELEELAQVAAAGIHDPSEMPFSVPWTDQPSPLLERATLQHYWRQRAEWTPESWCAGFCVFVAGHPVGAQDLRGPNFAVDRVVSSGSWLGRAHQGQGLGKEMRAAMLHLAFVGLGAVRAESGAWDDNTRSIAVSSSLGYETVGAGTELRRGEPARMLRFSLTRERWERHRRDDIEIHGLEACLPLFGLPAAG